MSLRALPTALATACCGIARLRKHSSFKAPPDCSPSGPPRPSSVLGNTDFEGSAKVQPKVPRGRSQDTRSDSPLLTLDLLLYGSGLVRHSKVLAGKVAESGTLAGMNEALDVQAGAAMVLDQGIATVAGIGRLREEG